MKNITLIYVIMNEGRVKNMPNDMYFLTAAEVKILKDLVATEIIATEPFLEVMECDVDRNSITSYICDLKVILAKLK